MITKKPLEPKNFKNTLLKSLITPVAILFLLVAVVLIQTDRLMISSRAIQHSDEVISQSLLLQKMITEMESSVRGFLLTGDNSDLGMYRENAEKVSPLIQSLRSLSLENTQQAERLDNIQTKYEEWTHFLSPILTQNRELRAPSSVALISSGQGKIIMDEIRGKSEQLLKSERYQKQERIDATHSYLSFSRATALGITLFLSAFLAFFSRNQIKNIAQSYSQTNEALFQKTQDLVTSNRELEQFAAIAAHDLKEPLRTITTTIQLVDRKYRDQCGSQATKYFDDIVNSSRGMHALIDSLLAYSRIGFHTKNLKMVDTSEALSTALTGLQTVVDEKHASIHVAALPNVLGDKMQLVQLFQNIIGNAIKFQHDSPPEVFVNVENLNSEWLFKIHDNGIGIDSQYTKKIFEMFRRFHPKDKFPGVGLGLAICKKIIDRHGGKIWVESHPGKGTTFFFTLPAAVNA